MKTSREMEEQDMLLEELIKEERKEALAEGRELGISEGRISDILELLSDLGEVPEDIRKALEEETDSEVLRTCLKKAAKAASMDEFRKFLTDRKER